MYGLAGFCTVFLFLFNALELNPIDGDPACVCVCLPPQISAPSVTCASPALSSVTCWVSPAAAPCGPGERCTNKLQIWKFSQKQVYTSVYINSVSLRMFGAKVGAQMWGFGTACTLVLLKDLFFRLECKAKVYVFTYVNNKQIMENLNLFFHQRLHCSTVSYTNEFLLGLEFLKTVAARGEINDALI